MSTPTKFKRDYFPRVAEAREALRERAMELFELQVQIIRQALLKGDFESAYKANQWLLDAMPPEDDGTRLVGPLASTPKELESKGGSGPTINIGIQLGGISTPKQLPEGDVIDVIPEKVDDPA